MIKSIYCFLTVTILVAAFIPAAAEQEGEAPSLKLPVYVSALENMEERTRGCLNLLTINQIQNAVKDGDEKALKLDLTGISSLLDGTKIDPGKIYGSIYVGPYPFESSETQYSYKRFRHRSGVQEGKADIHTDFFLHDKYNSEGWKTRGELCMRLNLYLEQEGQDRHLGMYDTFVGFRKEEAHFVQIPVITEGPFMSLIHSDAPSAAVVSFKTNRELQTRVRLDNGMSFEEENASREHEINLTSLQPDKDYQYKIVMKDHETEWISFHTAPEPGKGEIRFAYIGDSREGVGGGERNFMGLNYATLERNLAHSYMIGADFFAMGGDLVNGYTTVKEDFRTQLHAWKQTVAGYWNHRPVYPAMGNHEALLKNFDDGSYYGVSMDRWPYETDSAEAVFAEEFFNPKNGPAPSDPSRPPYGENVYSYRYGPVMMIAFNNNYWISYNADKYGGCPEGYIMPDQMKWIEKKLEEAEKDENVKYVILYAQEPVFPNGGHVKDAMWHNGNNAVRAYSYDHEKDALVAEEKGMLEVRNDFVRMVASSSKVAAVLGSDEHGYSKVLINSGVPIGDPEKDDEDGDGVIDLEKEKPSPLEDLKHPVWYMVCGGGGAPYYARESAPWNEYWEEQMKEGRLKKFFYYSSQANFFIFEADEEKISVMVFNPYGEQIDKVEDLMAVKK